MFVSVVCSSASYTLTLTTFVFSRVVAESVCTTASGLTWAGSVGTGGCGTPGSFNSCVNAASSSTNGIGGAGGGAGGGASGIDAPDCAVAADGV